MKTELEGRTLDFALRIVAFVGSFPPPSAGSVIGRQLLKSGTSIGANYREAGRAESKVDFVHKVGIAENILDESRQLLAILTTIGRNAKKR